MPASRWWLIAAWLLASPVVPAAETAYTTREQEPPSAAQQQRIMREHLRAGKSAYRRRQDDQAVRHFSQVLQWDPAHREARRYLEQVARRTPTPSDEMTRRQPETADRAPGQGSASTSLSIRPERGPAVRGAESKGSPNFAKTAARVTQPSPSDDGEARRLKVRERAMEQALQRQARRLSTRASR